MQANFDGMVPLWFDAGYRLSEQFYAGGYFQWGFALVSEEVCPRPLLRCKSTDLRFGLEVHWHFKSLVNRGSWAGAFDPWVGLGAGYESTIIQLSAGEAKSHQTDEGFEFGHLQLGGDYAGLAPWRIGAFTSLAIAEYTNRTTGTPAGSASSRSEEHTSELQSRGHLVCRLLLAKKNKNPTRALSAADREVTIS